MGRGSTARGSGRGRGGHIGLVLCWCAAERIDRKDKGSLERRKLPDRRITTSIPPTTSIALPPDVRPKAYIFIPII